MINRQQNYPEQRRSTGIARAGYSDCVGIVPDGDLALFPARAGDPFSAAAPDNAMVPTYNSQEQPGEK
jgi:hypothetical protein